MRFFISFAVAALATDMEYTQEALKDEIKALPGIPAGLNFRHFSGYITVKGHWAEHTLSASLYRFCVPFAFFCRAFGCQSSPPCPRIQGETPAFNRHIFYWFVESQTSPSTAPLIWWTNGGPGCSGLAGFLTEQGPFRVGINGPLGPAQVVHIESLRGSRQSPVRS